MPHRAEEQDVEQRSSLRGYGLITNWTDLERRRVSETPLHERPPSEPEPREPPGEGDLPGDPTTPYEKDDEDEDDD
jgi:hypothetical protein